MAVPFYTLCTLCGVSVFGANDFGGRRYLHNMAVNRGITGTARAVISLS